MTRLKNTHNITIMEEYEITPTRAYDLLTTEERFYVDEYVEYAVNEQRRKRERIIHALKKPIPTEYIRRTKQALYKPIVRAAIAERLREEADKEDISPSRVIKEHAKIAFSSVHDYMKSETFGQFTLRDIDDIEIDKLGAVKSIETRPGAFGITTKVVLHDKHASLKFLGDIMGLTVSDTTPALADYVKVEEAKKNAVIEYKEAYNALLEQTKK